MDKDALRALVDRRRDELKSGVVVPAGAADGKVLVERGLYRFRALEERGLRSPRLCSPRV